jgi:D-alanyl-D-alanine carboxypeptidase
MFLPSKPTFTMSKSITLIVSFWCIAMHMTSAQEPRIESFFKDHPNKMALCLYQEGSVIVGHNEEEYFPMASLSKTIIVIEYAYQVNSGVLDQEELISLSELDRYALDDDNYKNWLKRMKKDRRVVQNKVPIKFVAQGMIQFSANACADYMLNRLGLEQVNQRIGLLNLDHEPIFPFTASLLLAFNYEKKERALFLREAQGWDRETYRSKVEALNDRIVQEDQFLKSIRKNISQDSYKDVAYDSLWTAYFSRSTAKTYAELIDKINRRDFETDIQDQLTFLFETWVFADNPGIQESFDGLAYKGAGTNSLVNVWLYVRTKEGTTTQFVALFDHLTPEEYKLIEATVSNFGFEMCTNPAFQESWLLKQE